MRAFKFLGLVVGSLIIVGGAWYLSIANKPPELRHFGSRFEPRASQDGLLTVWWDDLPEDVKLDSLNSPDYSNILNKDYVGTDQCKACHPKQHSSWSSHSHRWMNAEATAQRVKGDFSGNATIDYLGGVASFFEEHDQHFMALQRGELKRKYEIHQTIGSRFFQYYVGRQLEGPEPKGHVSYHLDHVLPFGYWLSQSEWVPVVHIQGEHPDGERDDPYAAPSVYDYARGCSQCHTTRPLGDWMLRRTDVTGEYTPRPMSVFLSEFLREAHPTLLESEFDPTLVPGEKIESLREWFFSYDVRDQGVSQGITCEACHNGCREHVENPLVMPRFFPSSRHVYIQGNDTLEVFGRSDENINWICSRCHTGERPLFAAGMATWNSTEFSDASKGACYSKMTCVDCHDPHETIGPQWTRTPDQDDQSCLNCHRKYVAADERVGHTHHPIDSEGSRCMNCHMPKINEGMESVVRTHTIFSPTQKNMIESNQPNACNLCHLRESIDWTIGHLADWYGASFNERQVSRNYKERSDHVGVGWLRSPHESTRLVAAEAMIKADGLEWALSDLLESLDDSFLLNRQFAQYGLEKRLGMKLIDFGYRFYMTPEERAEPISRIRDHFAN